MKNLTFSSHYARAVLYGLEKAGGYSDQLLRNNGIDPEFIHSPRARVPTEQFIRLRPRKHWHTHPASQR